LGISCKTTTKNAGGGNKESGASRPTLARSAILPKSQTSYSLWLLAILRFSHVPDPTYDLDEFPTL
jgi:hypothetical protein